MAHTEKSILRHPHLNPIYAAQMRARRSAQRHNKAAGGIGAISVPKQPNRYLPHQGKKEQVRHAGKYAARPGHYAPLDRVKWVSSNKAKEGTVVAVVPAGKLPRDVDVHVKDANKPRDHVSYVVVANKKSYWPRVSLLARV